MDPEQPPVEDQANQKHHKKGEEKKKVKHTRPVEYERNAD